MDERIEFSSLTEPKIIDFPEEIILRIFHYLKNGDNKRKKILDLHLSKIPEKLKCKLKTTEDYESELTFCKPNLNLFEQLSLLNKKWHRVSKDHTLNIITILPVYWQSTADIDKLLFEIPNCTKKFKTLDEIPRLPGSTLFFPKQLPNYIYYILMKHQKIKYFLEIRRVQIGGYSIRNIQLFALGKTYLYYKKNMQPGSRDRPWCIRHEKCNYVLQKLNSLTGSLEDIEFENNSYWWS